MNTVHTFGTIAPTLVENGYRPIPIKRDHKKAPIPDDWTHFEATPEKIHEYRTGYTGILTAHTPAVDIDVRFEAAAEELDALAVELLGPAPRRFGNAPKRLLVYCTSAPFPKIQTGEYVMPGDDTSDPLYKSHKVEILGDGQQFVAFGIHRDTGKPYTWNGLGDPLTVPAGTLETLTEVRARTYIEAAEKVLAKYGTPAGKRGSKLDADPEKQKDLRGDPALVRSALEAIENDVDCDEWIKVAYAIRGALGDEGLEEFLRWSSRSPKFDDGETRRVWASTKNTHTGAKTIFRWARDRGWKEPQAEVDLGGMATPHAETQDAPEGPQWPDPLDPKALHGIAGEFVKLIEPVTESDPAAILLQFLVMFGAIVGRGPHYKVEATKHGANLFAVMVGRTSKARKGTSKDRVVSVLEQLAGWMGYVQGLSSGEGLKYAVRDRREQAKTDKKGNRTVEVLDEGVEDKRLLVIESEFAQPLKAVERSGNTLSPTVREAWDTGNLRTLTKNDPVTATGAHISILGHIVADELRAELAATDLANGFANRFLFVAVKRSKLLPFGGEDLDQHEVDDLVQRLARRLDNASSRQRVTMTEDAKALWAKVYPDLSEGHEGLHGSVTARAEAQCIRLALIYALLDNAPQIDTPHLEAALAVWRYCDDTAKHIFGAALGDRIADEILRRLQKAGEAGLTRSDIRDAFGRNVASERIGAALELLKAKGKATCATVATGGRPSEVWRATR